MEHNHPFSAIAGQEQMKLALILLLSILFGASMRITPTFFLVMLLKGMAFAALGVLSAIVARTHGDIARFSTFAILLLTYASGSLRSIAYGGTPNLRSILILTAYAAVFMVAANMAVIRRKKL